MLLLEIMVETLEKYISENFRMLPGNTLELSKSNLYGYINGIKCVIICVIKCYDTDRYVVYCLDEDGHQITTNAESVYMSKLNLIERILYVK